MKGRFIFIAMTILFATTLLLSSGCAAFGPNDAQTAATKEGYIAWVNQARYISPVEADGTNMTVTISVTGAHHFALNSAIDPLPMLPRDPTMWESAADTLKTVAPYVAAGALLDGTIGQGSSTTTHNTYAAPAAAAVP